MIIGLQIQFLVFSVSGRLGQVLLYTLKITINPFHAEPDISWFENSVDPDLLRSQLIKIHTVFLQLKVITVMLDKSQSYKISMYDQVIP